MVSINDFGGADLKKLLRSIDLQYTAANSLFCSLFFDTDSKN